MGTLKTTNIQTITGSGTLTLGTSGETVSFGSGVTGLSYPAFEAYLSSTQSLSDASFTKIQFDTEVFDTDNCYDNSTNYRFTPTVAGKYLVYGKIRLQSASNTELKTSTTAIYKNGSVYSKSQTLFWNSYVRAASPTTAYVIDMNGTSDYLELFGYIDVISGTPDGAIGAASDKETMFGAYRIGT